MTKGLLLFLPFWGFCDLFLLYGQNISSFHFLPNSSPKNTNYDMFFFIHSIFLQLSSRIILRIIFMSRNINLSAKNSSIKILVQLGTSEMRIQLRDVAMT